MRQQRGFSLIELLIVIAIILVLAAVAIPNLLRARMMANEASAVSSIRTISTTQMAYASVYPHLGFSDNLAKLGPAPPNTSPNENAADLLDWVLGCNTQPCPKSGFNFAIVNTLGTPVTVYQSTAVPLQVGRTGYRGFCGNHLSMITFDPTGGSNCTEPVR